jgi:ParB/RepB/Spo0J family partition protein
MLEVHPIADLFPLMEGADFQALVDSIRKNGLIHPIIVCDGKILDGRNRYRACLKAGVEPRYTEFSSIEQMKMVGLVSALNLERRHLNDSQRALVAAELVVHARMNAADAARKMNVSLHTTHLASTVMRHQSPQVVKLVAAGDVPVSRAYDHHRGRIKDEDLILKPGSTKRGQGRNGRPPGDARVTKFLKACQMLVDLTEGQDVIAQRWRGDPLDQQTLRKARRVMNYVWNRISVDDRPAAQDEENGDAAAGA